MFAFYEHAPGCWALGHSLIRSLAPAASHSVRHSFRQSLSQSLIQQGSHESKYSSCSAGTVFLVRIAKIIKATGGHRGATATITDTASPAECIHPSGARSSIREGGGGTYRCRGGGKLPQGTGLAEECLRAETKTKESEETKKWEGKEKRFVFRLALLHTSLHSLEGSRSGKRVREAREKGKRNGEKG